MISIERSTAPQLKPVMEGIRFGSHFSDHMFTMLYYKSVGWFAQRIVPYGTLTLEPAAAVFHYGQASFGGLKAVRGEDGKIRLFRAEACLAQMNARCAALSIPQIPEDIFTEAVMTLLDLDKDWVPALPEAALYLRPFVIATDPQLQLRASESYTFGIICSPAACYFTDPEQPIELVLGAEANKFAALPEGGIALPTEGESIRNPELMNLMFKMDGRIVTPETDDVMHASALALLEKLGFAAEKRAISAQELLEAARAGKIEEAWSVGMETGILPIAALRFGEERLAIGDGGVTVAALQAAVSGILRGTAEDSFGWTKEIG